MKTYYHVVNNKFILIPCPYNHALHDFRARLGYDKSQCDLSIPHLVLELTMHVMHS